MGFLAPWFLGGLAALGLPVYIHLLKQHKSIPLPFSSLMFFEQRTQSSIKHRRLKYLLLFAMRMAMVLLLALLFANPFITRTVDPKAQGKKLMIFAVDNSFSMRTADRFAAAKQQALEAVSGFRGGDLGQVVSFSTQVSLLTQQTEDPAELRSAIQSVTQGDGRSGYAELSQMLRSVAQASQTPVEVHIFSDMQKTSLPSPFSELALGGNTRVILHPTATADEPNWYVESVNAPRSVYQAKKVRVLATIAGAGTPALETDVSVALNNKVIETKKVKLAANGRATAEFYLPDAPYGLNRGEVRLAAHDKLAQDDKILFALERKEAGRVLFVHESRNPRGLLYYRAALDSPADAALTVDAIPTDQIANVSPVKYAFVVLSDVGYLPAEFEENLKKYVKAGGSVLISLGSTSATKPRVPIFDEAIAEARMSSRNADRFQAATSVDLSHPALSKTNSFEGVKFYQTIQVVPGQSRILAKLTDQTPLILEKKIGEGRAIVFASTFDNVANDFPLHTSFVPFIEQSAYYLSGVEKSSADVAVDSYLELRSSKDQGTSVELLDPDGKRALSLNESTSSQNFRLPREGFFEIRRANGRHELIAVHADRRESDLAVIPKETQALWQNMGMGGEQQNGPGGPGTSRTAPWSMWWYFALALLIVSVLESLFASRYLVAENQPMVRKEAA
ncbi:MAG: BatA domain-containing protein [Bryobacteraceae bacterium]